MKLTSSIRTTIVAVLGLGAFSLTGYSQNLLTNGDFELPALANGGIQFFTAPTTFPGFSVTAGSVDINRSVFPAFSGSQSIDLVGNDLGTIQQTFSTTIGRTYTLSFEYANSPYDAFSSTAPALGQATVILNGTTSLILALSHFDSTTVNMDYQLATLTFAALANQTTLQFQALNQGSTLNANGGIVIDAVSVVPEPSSLALIGISGGLTTLLALKRRRRVNA